VFQPRALGRLLFEGCHERKNARKFPPSRSSFKQKQNKQGGYTLRTIDKLQTLGKAHYNKKDLQPLLPAGYHNPLRVPQHY
jgi:hypothetical protein